MKEYKKALVPISILILLILSEIFMNKIEILRYTDEVATIFFAIHIIIKLITKKVKVSKNAFEIGIASIIVIIIGLISNIIWKVQANKFAILVDVLTTFKLIICCIGFYIMISEQQVKSILKVLTNPAKLVVILGFAFSIISLFLDIGMRGQRRFGIYGFNFIFQNAHIYSMFTIFCLLIILLNNSFSKSKKYVILAIVQMILTTKGPAIIWGPMLILFIEYFKRKDKIDIKVILMLTIISIILGGYQIQNYFLKENAPRAVFYKYALLNSKEHIPLGSGFATYGSNMAAKYYSPLYEEYGFNEKYGMKIDENLFLNDNYWPMILGQFGWIGMCIFIFIAYKLFDIMQKAKLDYSMKAIMFSAYFYTIIHSLGSSTFTMSITIILYMGIIMTLKLNKKGEREFNETDTANIKKSI